MRGRNEPTIGRLVALVIGIVARPADSSGSYGKPAPDYYVYICTVEECGDRRERDTPLKKPRCKKCGGKMELEEDDYS